MRRISAKEEIYNAFLKLILELPYDKITVRKVCERAEVSTVTFYRHFSGKEDLYYYGVHEAGKALYALMEDGGTWYDVLLGDFTAQQQMAEWSTNVTRNMDDYVSIIQVTTRSHMDLMRSYIERREGADAVDEDLEAVMRLYLYGVMQSMVDNVGEGMHAQPKTLARRAVLAMPELLRAHIPT